MGQNIQSHRGRKHSIDTSDYVGRVNEKQNQARTLLWCIQNTRRRTGHPTNTPSGDSAVTTPHHDFRSPPPLTKFPSGCLDSTHGGEIELWIEETEKNKNAFIAAVDRQETKLVKEMKENARVCNEYVDEARSLQDKVRRVIGPPHELLCPITQEVMVDPVMTVDGETYERAAIERVFEDTAKGEDPISPATELELESRLLIPNVALCSMCMAYREGK